MNITPITPKSTKSIRPSEKSIDRIREMLVSVVAHLELDVFDAVKAEHDRTRNLSLLQLKQDVIFAAQLLDRDFRMMAS